MSEHTANLGEMSANPEPYPTETKLPRECGARRRNGMPCKAPAMPNGKCRIHGGLSPKGTAAGRYKTGKYSKYLPKNIHGDYRAALRDENLISLREQLALLESRQMELVRGLEQNPPIPWSALQNLTGQLLKDGPKPELLAQLKDLIGEGQAAARAQKGLWSDLRSAFQEKARLVEAERRRLDELNARLPADQVITLVQALSDLVAKVFGAYREDLKRFYDEAATLLPPPPK